MATRVLTIRLPVDTFEKLDSVTTEKGKTVSEFVRDLIDEALYPSKDKGTATLWDSAGEELKAKVAEIDESVNQMAEDFTSGTEIRDKWFTELKSRVEKVEKLENSFTELEKANGRAVDFFDMKVKDFEARLLKLHICPDCGASLHMHLISDKTGDWHLECPLCGYCSENYGSPKWKEPRGKLFTTKPRPENTGDKKPGLILTMKKSLE